MIQKKVSFASIPKNTEHWRRTDVTF